MDNQNYLRNQDCVLEIVVLKVHIHCSGCKKIIKNLLQEIHGVDDVNIYSAQDKVVVMGNMDPNELIEKLNRSGRRAVIWGFQRDMMNNPTNDDENSNGRGKKTGDGDFLGQIHGSEITNSFNSNNNNGVSVNKDNDIPNLLQYDSDVLKMEHPMMNSASRYQFLPYAKLKTMEYHLPSMNYVPSTNDLKPLVYYRHVPSKNDLETMVYHGPSMNHTPGYDSQISPSINELRNNMLKCPVIQPTSKAKSCNVGVSRNPTFIGN